MLNPDRNLEKYNDPFPHIIIKNFFKKDFYEKLENEFPKKEIFENQKNNVGRMHYDTTFGHALYQNIINESEVYNRLHNYIYSEEFIKSFLDLFGLEIENEINKSFLKIDVKKLEIREKPFEVGKLYNKQNLKKKGNSFLYPRLDIGIGEKGYGIKTGGKGIHIDNPQRLISILFYVGGFTKIEGGEHRLWEKLDNKPKISKEIEPKPNSLVASLQNNISYHDVNPITEISGVRNAFYIAISCNNPMWKEVEANEFNLKNNRNRCKQGFFSKIKQRLFA